MNIKKMLLPLIIILLSTSVLFFLDQPYHSILSSITSHDSNQKKEVRVESPEKTKLNYLKENHWKASNIYSNLEDVFYPFRKWDKNPLKSVVNQVDYASYKSQINGLAKNEKATYVRARKAYFFAERLKFSKAELNHDFKIKNNQWLAVFDELFNRKITLKNGTYQTYINAVLIMLVLMCLALIFGYVTMGNAVILSFVLFISLIASSQTIMSAIGIPFHWLFIILILFKLDSKVELSSNQYLFIGGIIFFSVWSYSLIAAILGLAIIIAGHQQPLVQKAMRSLYIFHPLGVLFLKKNQISYFLFLGLIGLIVAYGVGVSLKILGPLAYLDTSVKLFAATLLCCISGECIQKAQPNFKKVDVLFIAFACIGLIILKQTALSSVFSWSFEFLLYPIIMWVGILYMLGRIEKKSQ